MRRSPARFRTPARRATVLVALVLLGAGCAEQKVSEGIYLARQGDYSEAVESFRAAVRSDPESAIAHYNLGYALHADVLTRAGEGRFEGTEDEVRAANSHLLESVGLDPDRFARDAVTARDFFFSELYNLAIDKSAGGAMDDAQEILGLARITTDDALSTQRARVLALKIEMSQALASRAVDSREQYMRVLAELQRIRDQGPVDDALVDEIVNTIARAHALISADDE